MQSHKELIEKFYTSFQNLNAEEMVSCYHPDVQFYDPVFKTLNGKEAADMWRMLVLRGGSSLKITFSNIDADTTTGSAHWQADYVFSKTNRVVCNKIKARFTFQDDLIIQHHDEFNFWNWSKMALGIPGFLLGWTSFLNKKVSEESRRALHKFQNRN